MTNHELIGATIKVHGRGSLVIPVKVMVDNLAEDISGWNVWFEADQVQIREKLTALGADLVLSLDRTQVETLKDKGTKCAIISENKAANNIYFVLWAGTIERGGYKNTPDTVEG